MTISHVTMISEVIQGQKGHIYVNDLLTLTNPCLTFLCKIFGLVYMRIYVYHILHLPNVKSCQLFIRGFYPLTLDSI